MPTLQACTDGGLNVNVDHLDGLAGAAPLPLLAAVANLGAAHEAAGDLAKAAPLLQASNIPPSRHCTALPTACL